MINSHEIDYKIFGNDIQVLEVELDQQETVIAEAGAMVYMEEGIEFEAKMGDGSNPRPRLLREIGLCRLSAYYRRIAVHGALHAPRLRQKPCSFLSSLPRHYFAY